MKKWLLSCGLLLLPMLWVMAQELTPEANAKGLRAGGKIGVVLAVCITILAGLLIYLYRIDKKITALEREEKR